MKTVLKLALSLTALSAALGLAAQPATALSCFPKFMGCSYSGITQYENSQCCTYRCPGGGTVDGVCEVTY